MHPRRRPCDISTPEERPNVPQVKEFFVDRGMDVKEWRKKVRVGDFMVMDEPFIEVGRTVVSKALDNRFACWLGIETIRGLEKSGAGHACEIHVAFTTQEEVGLRGARTSSFAIKPDIGLGIDVSLSCDTPGVPESGGGARGGRPNCCRERRRFCAARFPIPPPPIGSPERRPRPCLPRSRLGRADSVQ